MRLQWVRKFHPCFWPKRKRQKETRFTLSVRVAQQVANHLRFIDAQPVQKWHVHTAILSDMNTDETQYLS